MHCMACGAQMILVKAIEDVSMLVPGFERSGYMCSFCNETEQRLVFNKPGEQAEAAIAPASTSVVPTPTSRNLIQRAENFVRSAPANSFDLPSSRAGSDLNGKECGEVSE